MSTQSVGVVRELYERFPDLAAGRPPPDLLELFDPEVRLDQTRNVFNPAEFEGRDGVLTALSVVRETWEQFVIEPERFVETGDHVVVIHTVRARARRWRGRSRPLGHPAHHARRADPAAGHLPGSG